MKTPHLLPCFAAILCATTSRISAETPIEVGPSYGFSQPESTTTVYRVAIPQPGEYRIHIGGWISTYNWGTDYDRLYLYNDEGDTVQRGEFSYEEDPFAFHMFQDSDQLIFRVGTAGSYTIHIHSGDLPGEGASQSYTLQVTGTSCNDSHEANDSLAAATGITLGATVQGYQWRRTKTRYVEGDEDWYRIQVPTPGKLKIALVGWEAVYNWGADFDRLFVYDANGNNIGGNPDDGDYGYFSWMMGGGTDEEPVVIEMNLAQGGTYYLRFHAGVAAPVTPYHFTTSFTQANDTFEPNDEFATAKPISRQDTWYNAFAWRSLDQSMNITGDEDYYYFHAASAGTYTLTLENWVSIYNWGADYDRMDVFDANKESIGDSPLSWMMGTNPVTFEVPAAGKYYIRLHCGAGTSLDGYRFKLNGNLLGAEIAVKQPARKNLSDGKTTSNFGKVRVGKKSKAKTYTIRNQGVSTLKIQKISKSGPAAKSFLVSKPGRSSLAPGQSTTFKVVFKPKAKGKLKAAIRIKNNDPDENPFDIRLLGKGLK